MTDINDAIEAIAAAIEAWTGADWPHEMRRAGRPVRNDDDQPVYCEGHLPGCEYCEVAGDEAADAAAHGRAAIAALRRGDRDEALDALYESVSCELEFGDSPTWGRVRDMVEQLDDDVPDDDSYDAIVKVGGMRYGVRLDFDDDKTVGVYRLGYGTPPLYEGTWSGYELDMPGGAAMVRAVRAALIDITG